jgi:hypothetical protein
MIIDVENKDTRSKGLISFQGDAGKCVICKENYWFSNNRFFGENKSKFSMKFQTYVYETVQQKLHSYNFILASS